MENLRHSILLEAATHDTPIGVLHPYWARKPLNIVEQIIKTLSAPGDLVVDPFMGSGTTVFASLTTGRRALGNDLNPLSRFMVEGLLQLASDGDQILPELERILSNHSEITLPWFHIGAQQFIERERFNVRGEFSFGEFTLERTETIAKSRIGGKWTGRRVLDETTERTSSQEDYSKFLSNPLDFDSASLQENSRIAIPSGATLAHYFTEENRASINVLTSLLKESELFNDFEAGLKVILSASLPLLRLSDAKASSQWPYWRPKTRLTSRNPVMVLERKLKQIRDLVQWGHAKHFLPSAEMQDRYSLKAGAAQRLAVEDQPTGADLVLTDPPYGDQVPYLEYSAMWHAVLELPLPSGALDDEIVKTDARSRRNPEMTYGSKISEAIKSSARLTRTGGHVAWFYQDQDLHSWKALRDAALISHLELVDVISIPKQRRSLKTVTSPNTTLDGDLLCVFKKVNHAIISKEVTLSLEELALSLQDNRLSYFEKYAILIEKSMKSGLIKELAHKFGSVKRAFLAIEGDTIVLAAQ